MIPITIKINNIVPIAIKIVAKIEAPVKSKYNLATLSGSLKYC